MPYTDYYSLEDFVLIAGTRTGMYGTARSRNAGNYESHQPCSQPSRRAKNVPIGRSKIGFDGIDADLRTARYAYALMVLEAAHARMLDKYPDWLDHEWVIQEPGWRRLVFKSPQRRQAEEYCDSLVHEIANSGEVVLSESLQIETVKERKKMLLIRNIPDFDDVAVDAVINGMKNGINPWISQGDLRFSYEEIACHIVRLDERMLSLLNSDDGWPPLTDADRELFDAASHLDKSRMEAALARGANVNALDDGESVMTHAIGAMAWEHKIFNAEDDGKEAENREYATEQRLAIVNLLLDRGADINLFGVEGLSPLSTAVLKHDPRVVRYLLKRGADPSSDQFPEESFHSEPTACYYADGDLHCVSEECSEYVDLWEINVLIDVAIVEKQLTRGVALDTIMLLPDSKQHWVGTVGANYLIALAWNRLDADVLELFLAEDVAYVSQHALKPLVGKLAVMEYVRDKMRTCHKRGTKVFAELGVYQQGPCVMIAQGQPEKLCGTILVRLQDGCITRIDILGIDLVPLNGRAIGIVPR